MSPRLSDLFLRSQSDERLVSLARDGHERAFAAIVERYGPELQALARRLCANGRAEDVVQEAFLSAFAALRSGAEVKHLRGWLYRIVRNAANRSRGPICVPLDGTLPSAETVEEVVQQRALALTALEELALLPERQREAMLGTARGMPRAEVANSMGLSEGAVRQLVHRARSSIRTAVTAVTPLPLARWFAGLGQSTPRAAQLAAGAGVASSGGVAVKVGALLASGTLVTGVAVVHIDGTHSSGSHHESAPGATPARLYAGARRPPVFTRAASASSVSVASGQGVGRGSEATQAGTPTPGAPAGGGADIRLAPNAERRDLQPQSSLPGGIQGVARSGPGRSRRASGGWAAGGSSAGGGGGSHDSSGWSVSVLSAGPTSTGSARPVSAAGGSPVSAGGSDSALGAAGGSAWAGGGGPGWHGRAASGSGAGGHFYGSGGGQTTATIASAGFPGSGASGGSGGSGASGATGGCGASGGTGASGGGPAGSTPAPTSAPSQAPTSTTSSGAAPAPTSAPSQAPTSTTSSGSAPAPTSAPSQAPTSTTSSGAAPAPTSAPSSTPVPSSVPSGPWSGGGALPQR